MRSNRIRDDDALALPQSDDDAPAPPALPQPRRAWRSTVGPALLALTVFIVSLTVRFWNLDLVITTDEGYWMQRSVRFAAALDRRDWGGTFRAGHPGVTVMWAATLGVRPTAMAPRVRRSP